MSLQHQSTPNALEGINAPHQTIFQKVLVDPPVESLPISHYFMDSALPTEVFIAICVLAVLLLLLVAAILFRFWLKAAPPTAKSILPIQKPSLRSLPPIQTSPDFERLSLEVRPKALLAPQATLKEKKNLQTAIQIDQPALFFGLDNFETYLVGKKKSSTKGLDRAVVAAAAGNTVVGDDVVVGNTEFSYSTTSNSSSASSLLNSKTPLAKHSNVVDAFKSNEKLKLDWNGMEVLYTQPKKAGSQKNVFLKVVGGVAKRTTSVGGTFGIRRKLLVDDKEENGGLEDVMVVVKENFVVVESINDRHIAAATTTTQKIDQIPDKREEEEKTNVIEIQQTSAVNAEDEEKIEEYLITSLNRSINNGHHHSLNRPSSIFASIETPDFEQYEQYQKQQKVVKKSNSFLNLVNMFKSSSKNNEISSNHFTNTTNTTSVGETISPRENSITAGDNKEVEIEKDLGIPASVGECFMDQKTGFVYIVEVYTSLDR